MVPCITNALWLTQTTEVYAGVCRVEFEQYLPDNTQGVIVQPIGDQGVLIAATDTQRGFGKLDQVCGCFS